MPFLPTLWAERTAPDSTPEQSCHANAFPGLARTAPLDETGPAVADGARVDCIAKDRDLPGCIFGTNTKTVADLSRRRGLRGTTQKEAQNGSPSTG